MHSNCFTYGVSSWWWLPKKMPTRIIKPLETVNSEQEKEKKNYQNQQVRGKKIKLYCFIARLHAVLFIVPLWSGLPRIRLRALSIFDVLRRITRIDCGDLFGNRRGWFVFSSPSLYDRRMPKVSKHWLGSLLFPVGVQRFFYGGTFLIRESFSVILLRCLEWFDEIEL